MPVSQDDKFAIIDELENTRTKGNRLVITLLFAGKKTEAADARKKVKELGAAIDGLLAESMKKWSGRGKAIIADMKKANGLLQRDISYIQKKKEHANKVVNALGRLDEAIVWAKDLLT
jgi:hypothetical protein